jgi:hypothetical protein
VLARVRAKTLRIHTSAGYNGGGRVEGREDPSHGGNDAAWTGPDFRNKAGRRGIAAKMDVVSESVTRITGEPAQALEPFLRANPNLWEKLTV